MTTPGSATPACKMCDWAFPCGSKPCDNCPDPNGHPARLSALRNPPSATPRRKLWTLLFAMGCSAPGWNSLPTEPERIAWRVSQAKSQGLAACDSRPIGRDETCYDRYGITWSGCAWAICGGDDKCVRDLDQRILDGSCGGPGYKPCEARR